MPKYNVDVDITLCHHLLLEVEADNKYSAGEKAEEMALDALDRGECGSPGVDWRGEAKAWEIEEVE